MTDLLRVIVVTAGLFVLITAPASAQTVSKRICKPAVSGAASAFLEHSAKRESVHDWREKVKSLYGADWAEYSLSKVKTFPCNRNGWFAQACKVKAQPCREVGQEVASLKNKKTD